MTENVNTENTGRKKRITGSIAAGIGALGVAALAIGGTAANWTDSESAGVDFQAGQFDLEIATTVVGGTPDAGDWTTGSTVSSHEALSSIDSISQWGPGDSASATVHVRLADDTTHDATLTSDRESTNTTAWSISGPDDINQSLNTGQTAEFDIDVTMDNDPSNDHQGDTADVVWTFTAEQQSN